MAALQQTEDEFARLAASGTRTELEAFASANSAYRQRVAGVIDLRDQAAERAKKEAEQKAEAARVAAEADAKRRLEEAAAAEAKRKAEAKRTTDNGAAKKREAAGPPSAKSWAERYLRGEDSNEVGGRTKGDPIAALVPGSGQSARDCDECPEMVVVPAGTFMMGSPDSEEGRSASEGPQRTVEIVAPFAVGKFEVTFDEWAACVTGGGCQSNKTPSNEGWGGGRRPVINVSWNDAQQYVAWLSKKTGQTYQLLSEAEWEYAARAGTSTPFSFGAWISTDRANYHGGYTQGAYIYGVGVKGLYREKTIEVGSLKAPNRWGLHDMHGNVWEWVEDCWIENYRGAPADSAARKACADDWYRVSRGGAWNGHPEVLRSATRGWGSVGDGSSLEGFRVARSLPPQKN